MEMEMEMEMVESKTGVVTGDRNNVPEGIGMVS